MRVDISIIHVCILIQRLCLEFFKNLVFTLLRSYGISVIVYWCLLVRLWVELFASKRLVQVKTVVHKKANKKKKRKCNKNDNKVLYIYIIYIFIYLFFIYIYIFYKYIDIFFDKTEYFFYIYNFTQNYYSPDDFWFIIALQYTDNKFLQPSLQGNKYNNPGIEIFKPCNSQPSSLSCNPPKSLI